MKRILINATQNEEIRVALCKGNHLYDFDLENRTREQKKSNIYKGHVTRVEPSLEAVFVEYGSQRQGFLPIREISTEYLSGNPRDENIKKLIKEGDELIVQVEKEERGNKGAALSTYVSLAGRYLVLMPNNPRGGGISRQISGKLREDMKRMLGNLDLPKGMSVIIRTAGIGKTQEDLQHDLNHLLNIWQAIQEQNQKYPSPRLVHQEAGVVTRAVRDYLRDDISEIWIDNENAYIEAAGFIDAVMPKQAEKLRKYTDYEPMFSRFNIEKQIETAYQREVRLPSGGSIVIDQTEALVSIDINSAKSTKGSDVAETAYHTNLEAADEIARQLRLRDMGGLIVIDFIDMNDNKHQKEVEKRLIDATKYDRARVQFGDISKFGLMEMSRQRLRPSLEESTGYICPRCHGNGMIRDLRSLSLSIMRQIEQIALKERQGEVQAEVPTDIAAFLLNEKRDALVYLEQDSGTRITILPHAHLESPNFKLHFNRDGFAPSSYERITDTAQEHSDLGYEVDWQTAEKERPEQQPTRQPRQSSSNPANKATNHNSSHQTKTEGQNNGNQNPNQRAPDRNNSNDKATDNTVNHSNEHRSQANRKAVETAVNTVPQSTQAPANNPVAAAAQNTAAQPQAVAWLSNLFAQAPQAKTANVSSRDAAEAIEALVNTGAQSLGSFGQTDNTALSQNPSASTSQQDQQQTSDDATTERQQNRRTQNDSDNNEGKSDDRRRRKTRKSRSSKPQRKEGRDETSSNENSSSVTSENPSTDLSQTSSSSHEDKSDNRHSDDSKSDNNKRHNDRNNRNRQHTNNSNDNDSQSAPNNDEATEQTRAKRKPHSKRHSRGALERGETLDAATAKANHSQNDNQRHNNNAHKGSANARRNQNPNEVTLQVNESPVQLKSPEVVHLSLDDSKAVNAHRPSEKSKVDKDASDKKTEPQVSKAEIAKDIATQPETSVDSTQPIDQESVQSETARNETSTADHTATNIATHTSNNVEKLVKEGAAVAKDDNTSDTAESTVTTEQILSSDQRSKPVVEEESVVTTNESTTSESTVQDKPATQTNPASTAKVNNAEVDSAFKLDHKELFATRYVTANKFGQASNDPRVVLREQALSTPQKAKSEVAVTDTPDRSVNSISTVRGSVGTFIRDTLDEAEKRLADEGVIHCFIAAIAEHTKQKLVTTNTVESEHPIAVANDIGANAESISFSFSNYGYEPLDTEYLQRFKMMTEATSQVAIEQGKTAVALRSITQRASNDPRGQHPEYQEVAKDEAEVTHLAENDLPPKQQATLTTPNHSDEAIDVDAHDVDATALSGEAQADNVTTKSEHLLADQALDSSEDQVDPTQGADAEHAAPENVQAEKLKTTIASYKNMIENVAEQLLPQTGMFNLTTPKVPKARTRKPKTEHKKPTQAEKAEVINTSDTDTDS